MNNPNDKLFSWNYSDSSECPTHLKLISISDAVLEKPTRNWGGMPSERTWNPGKLWYFGKGVAKGILLIEIDIDGKFKFCGTERISWVDSNLFSEDFIRKAIEAKTQIS